MSHELRSPLNAILGFAQLMESESPPPTPPQTESIAQILTAGWHLLKLIDEILDLAKVESGQVPLSQEPVSLADVIGECTSMIEAAGAAARHPPPRPRARLTPVRPRRSHARQCRSSSICCRTRSSTTTRTGRSTVTCAGSPAGRIRVSVTDTGAGLDTEQLAQLFQAFNRLGQEAGGEQGTGIGLVVAKRLVELMGGTIGIDSTVGVGTCLVRTRRDPGATVGAGRAGDAPAAAARPSRRA